MKVKRYGDGIPMEYHGISLLDMFCVQAQKQFANGMWLL